MGQRPSARARAIAATILRRACDTSEFPDNRLTLPACGKESQVRDQAGGAARLTLLACPNAPMAAKTKNRSNEATIENRRARRDFFIDSTLECGIRLTGTEIKSVRDGQVSLAEGTVRATETPPSLTLHGAHIAEYAPAGEHRQHDPIRVRTLLAHRREIRKLAARTRSKGSTLMPLKMYFVNGRAKLLIGVARGKRQRDKRLVVAEREMKRDMQRAMSSKRK